MAMFNRTEMGLKKVGGLTAVPNDPRARLMYYLDCVCSVIHFDENEDIFRLRQYQSYFMLSRLDRHVLIRLCLLFGPQVLLGKCFFVDDELCGDKNNAFYEVETVRNRLVVAGSVLVGDQQRHVNKIMVCKLAWVDINWTVPMRVLIDREKQDVQAHQAAVQQQRKSKTCVIL